MAATAQTPLTDVAPAPSLKLPSNKPSLSRRWRTKLSKYLWLVSGLTGLVAITISALLPNEQQMLSLLISGLPAVGILIALFLYRPQVRKAWIVLGLGMFGFFLSALFAALPGEHLTRDLAFSGQPPHWLTIASVTAFFAGFILNLVGAFWLAWGKRNFNKTFWADLGIITIACGYLIWFIVLDSVLDAGAMPEIPLPAFFIYLCFLVLSVDLVLRLAFGATRRPPAFWLFLAAIGAMVISQSWYAFALARGGYEPNGLATIVWQTTSVLWAMTALHPSMVRLSKSVTTISEVAMPRWRLGSLLVAALIPSLLLLLDSQNMDSVDLTVIAIGTGAMFAIIILRLTNLLASLRNSMHQRESLTEELRVQATHDPLTGLANRTRFTRELQSALRQDPNGVAVLYYDLDDFKGVNDRLGHGAGDELLLEVARRLQTQMRATDLAARLGGDEFGLLLTGLVEQADAIGAAERIIADSKVPYAIAGENLYLGASVGIAFGNASESGDEVLRNSDIAMYLAKSEGKGQYELFQASMHTEAVNRIAMRASLEHAIEHRQFVVYYQPIVDLNTGRATAIEALVRWQHPERGLIQPNDFIPVAEATGLIVPLGGWVLNEACNQVADWVKRGVVDSKMVLTVNLAPAQIRHPQIVTDVKEALIASGLAPAQLILEVTEGVIGDGDKATTILEQIRALGVRIAIDDFGTGYSTLGRLNSLPIDHLKIDRSFINVLGLSDQETSLTEAVLKIAGNLKLSTVAEGIESKEQAQMLRALGCELGQGFLFSRPIDAGAAESYLQANMAHAVDIGSDLDGIPVDQFGEQMAFSFA